MERFEAVLAVSEKDRELFEEVAGRDKEIFVIPIAVDTDQLLPVEREKETSHIIHVGTMFWQPNIDGVLWFIREVYPLIRKQRPDIVFDIIGARPSQRDYFLFESQRWYQCLRVCAGG